jgi:ABC-2 type transport system ATP-binding protein
VEREPVISIRNLTKHYGAVRAVDDISFEIFRGEIFGFLGPNGAGKTTSIRLLLDLLRPDSGEVNIFGLPLASHSLEIRKRCGYLPGNYVSYGNLTAMELFHLVADLRDIPREVDRGLMERFGLSKESLSSKMKYLSHGTQQKIGIIQALFHQPELLILDEPTIGLDPLMQEEFYKLLEERRNEGCTIFLSSHNLAEVEKICDRMAIIRSGRIEKVDTIANLRKLLKKKLRFTLAVPKDDIVIPGAELVSRQGDSYEYIVTGDLQSVFRALAELPLKDVSLPEPGLDEIFINFYREGADD